MSTADTSADRPSIAVRPLEPRSESAYVMATATDAFAHNLGGRYVLREVVRDLVRQLLDRCRAEIAFDHAGVVADSDVILGFALWAPDAHLELIYLRQSLARKHCIRCGGEYDEHFFGREHADHRYNPVSEPLGVARDVTSALLGRDRLIRMRRPPPQSWAWRTIHLQGYAPIIAPGAL